MFLEIDYGVDHETDIQRVYWRTVVIIESTGYVFRQCCKGVLNKDLDEAMDIPNYGYAQLWICLVMDILSFRYSQFQICPVSDVDLEYEKLELSIN